MHGEPAHAPLARALVDAAYRAGARYVDLVYVDPAAKRSRIQHADAETLGGLPAWHEQRMKALLAADASIVSITGESTPGLLGGLDPARAALERTSRLPGQRVYLRAIELGRARFCVVAWPVPGWAGPAYPELDPDAATERVAADLLEFCRLAPDDPPDAWARHLERLTARAEALTELALDRIELRGAGTSLDLGLSPGTRWVAARERDHTESHVLRQPAHGGGLHEPGRRARRRHLRLHAAAGPGRPAHHGHPRRVPPRQADLHRRGRPGGPRVPAGATSSATAGPAGWASSRWSTPPRASGRRGAPTA